MASYLQYQFNKSGAGSQTDVNLLPVFQARHSFCFKPPWKTTLLLHAMRVLPPVPLRVPLVSEVTPPLITASARSAFFRFAAHKSACSSVATASPHADTCSTRPVLPHYNNNHVPCAAHHSTRPPPSLPPLMIHSDGSILWIQTREAVSTDKK